MLFLLTGDVQIGKTRWLERLVAELVGEGVQVAGVLAPGVWRVREAHEAPGERGLSGKGRFEKLGIDNVLLPGGERVPFARRQDLALAEGLFYPTSQSAFAQLSWEIADEAIALVNAHFDRIAADPDAAFAGAGAGKTPADPSVGGSRVVVVAGEPGAEGSVAAGAAGGLLVVDELGILELMHDSGLVSAMALLERGPSVRFPHALVVVRDWLCPRAKERFAAVWGGSRMLLPGDDARGLVRASFGLSG